MKIVKETEHFNQWLKTLKDERAKVAIVRRIDRMTNGNLGDYKSVGDGILELRVQTNTAYRVYFTIINGEIYLLLLGGNKSTQQGDIQKSKQILQEIKSCNTK